MKKVFLIASIFGGVVALGSCGSGDCCDMTDYSSSVVSISGGGDNFCESDYDEFSDLFSVVGAESWTETKSFLEDNGAVCD